MVKFLITILIVVSISSANMYRFNNEGSQITIHYSIGVYSEVKTGISNINTLRRQYSEGRICKNALIQRTTEIIKNLSILRGIQVTH